MQYIFIFFFVCIFGQNTLYAHPISRTITPKNTVYITDLDDVLIKRDWKRVGKELIHVYKNAPNKAELRRVLRSVVFWKDVINAFRKKIVIHNKKVRGAKEHLNFFAQKYSPLKKIKKDIAKAIFYAKPIRESFKILDELKKNKYQLVLATNKDRLGYELTRKHLKKEYQIDLKHYFSHVFTANRSIGCKPDKTYYSHMNQALGEGTYKIFVDDKKENITGAEKVAHFFGHHFKSPKKLRTFLALHHVLSN